MNNNRSLRVFVTVVAVLLVAVLVGWAFLARVWDTAPDRSEAVGVWQRGNSDMRVTLYPSGKITFSDIPKGVIDFGQGEHEGATKPVTLSGKWSPFWDYGWWGGVSSGYTVSDGNSGQLYSEGNSLIGRQLSLQFGDDDQYEYNFHRVSTTP